MPFEFCPLDSDIQCATANFCLLDFSSITVEIAVRLLPDSRLKIENEDWLLNCIIGLISSDCKFAVLLDGIESQYFSVELIMRFTELVCSFGQSMNLCVWSSLCRRLIHQAANPHARGRLISLDGFCPLDGLFSTLWKSYGQNSHLIGLIVISAGDERTNRTFESHNLISEASNLSVSL
jgi:hypothetical protein